MDDFKAGNLTVLEVSDSLLSDPSIGYSKRF